MMNDITTTERKRVAEFMEWDKKDPSSSSWVSPKHGYFFIGLGKTASTRIKLTLHIMEGYPILERPFPWLHARDREGAAFVPKLADFDTKQASHILTSTEWFRFCFVRNPYDRLLAAYKFCIMQEIDPPSAYYNRIREDIHARFGYSFRAGRAGGTINFRDFVQYVEQTIVQQPDYHWCKMVWGFRPDLINYDFVGYFENFEHDFRQVLQRLGVHEEMMAQFLKPVNQSQVKKMPLAAFYDWKLADQVYEIYKEDFEIYGYEKNSWLLD